MYRPIIGLEVHVELKTKSKVFCSCLNDPMEHRPNVNICPVCLGHPGTLPVINEEAVKKVIKTGIALNCEIPEYSKFDRKQYFYPDLPKGYQISQFYYPFCRNGFLGIGSRKIRIREIHLEEDTGRLIHPTGTDYSLIDFNRAGVPLMELVTEPDIKSSQEARMFAEELQLIIRYLGVSDADMEKGEMRIEANVSLTKTKELGNRVEIKNLNSFSSVEKALKYEIERQRKVLESHKKVAQETRGWNGTKNITVSQRGKEEAHDYRYFPEPDLPRLHLGVPEYLNKVRAEIPELPIQRRERLKREYNLTEETAEIFVRNKDLGDYFEKAMSELRNWIKESELKERLSRDEILRLTKLCSNYMVTDLQSLLKSAKISNEDFLISPENFAEFISLIYEGKISSKIAKILLKEMFSTGEDPSHIIQEKELIQLTDEKMIETVAEDVLEKNKKAVEDVKKGKTNALQFLIGQVMAGTKGKANPDLVNKVLRRSLDNLNSIPK